MHHPILTSLSREFFMLAQMPSTLEGPSNHWFSGSPWSALLWTAVFSLFGTLIAIVGYKLFDAATPGNLHEEIIENKNMAAAMIGAAIILGVCIVVAASIVG